MRDPDYCNKWDNDEEFACPACLMISQCCGAKPLGSVDEDAFGNLCGVCSECNQISNFEKDTDDENYS